MKILIVDDEKEMREVLRIGLSRKFDPRALLFASSGQAAKDLIDGNRDIQLIITDCWMVNGTGLDVFRYAKKTLPVVEVIFATGDDGAAVEGFGLEGVPVIIRKPYSIKELLLLVSDAAARNQILSSDGAEEQFHRIDLAILRSLGGLPRDVYLKLSDSKYIKVFNRGDAFEIDDEKRCVEKAVCELYVRRADYPAVIDALTRKIETAAGAGQRLPARKSAEFEYAALRISREVFSTLGLNSSSEMLIQQNVRLALKSVRDGSRELSDLFEEVTADPHAFVCSHSVMLSHVACALSFHMTWTSDFAQYKFCLASFLHDLTLPRMDFDEYVSKKNDTQVDIRQKAPEKRSRMSFLAHPENAAKLVGEMRGMPPDVENIVAQHHERPDGTGFPHRLGHRQIAPLAAVFIVAHMLVDQYYATGRKELNIPGFLDGLPAAYKVGTFKKIFSTLSALTSARRKRGVA